jgi:hypothetical protein
MVLIALGIGQIVTPLLLGYAIAFAYVLLGIVEGRAPIPASVTVPESSGPQLAGPDAEEGEML